VIYLLEDHTLPIVRGIAYAKGTPLWVERGKVGLGPLTGEVMRSGGTAKHPGDALDDRLASIGAAVETSYDGREMANASFHCLADNTNEVVALWAEIMREPAFPDTKIELSRVGLRRQIASRNDDMSDVLFRVMRQAVYGKDNIWYWSREPEYATIEAVTRQDCIALHRKLFEPSRMVLALYGDFRAADMTKLLTSKLGDWKGAHEPFPPIPPVPTDSKPRLVFATRKTSRRAACCSATPGSAPTIPTIPR
jgi:zinc protease